MIEMLYIYKMYVLQRYFSTKYFKGSTIQDRHMLLKVHMSTHYYWLFQIQVIEDDRKSRSGQFQTGERAIVPPLVTTDMVVEDQAVCSPRFLRSTMYSVPVSADMLKQAQVPFVLSVQPFARVAPTEVRWQSFIE